MPQYIFGIMNNTVTNILKQQYKVKVNKKTQQKTDNNDYVQQRTTKLI